VFDGVLDIADIYLGLRGKLTTSTVRSAYGKDLLKRTIKGAFRKAARYRVDGTFELTPEELFEGAHKSLGVQAPGGGALKQLLQNLSEGKGILGYGKGGSGWAKAYGKGVSKVYGPTESVLSLVDGTKKSMGRCEELRQQMSTIRTIFNQSNSALETAQTDLAIAQSSIAAIDKNIAELKQAFPHRFKNL
jgi:hypothetical protein